MAYSPHELCCIALPTPVGAVGDVAADNADVGVSRDVAVVHVLEHHVTGGDITATANDIGTTR